MTADRDQFEVLEGPALLRREQVCRYLQVSPQTLNRWIRDGRMPPPLGGSILWSRRQIDQYLASWEAEAQDPGQGEIRTAALQRIQQLAKG